jgi:zinc D-Ala-D-Ala dipeptidase
MMYSVRKYRVRYVLSIAVVASATACVLQSAPTPEPVNTEELRIGSDSAADSLLMDVRAVAPQIRVGLRYATSENFTGLPLPGYEGNHAYMRRQAAVALAQVQRRAELEGLGLLVFDAYRPVRATGAMVEWTQRTGRADLLRDGYIASRSRHNLGLAIDLTLVDLGTGTPLEMGTPFDTFSSAAHTSNATGTALANRRRLQHLMESEGFLNYDQEWWHYSYAISDPVRFDRIIR